MFNRALKYQLEELQLSSQQDQAYLQSLKLHSLYAEYDHRARLLDASKSFANKLGRTAQSLIGVKHDQLSQPVSALQHNHRDIWQTLIQGQSVQFTQSYETEDGPVWLDSLFIPVHINGELYKVLQIASDVTLTHQQTTQQNGVINALNRSMAVIEFTPEGYILQANDNFLQAVGYSLQEIKGKHHEMFCTREFYQRHPDFWRELAAGSFKSGRFERRTARAEVLWLEATYNPVLDDSGRVIKVVKFASDITEQVRQNQQVAQAAQVAKTSADETSSTSLNGSKILDTALENFNSIDSQVNNTVALINQLNEQSSQIKAIVSTISAIAEQTNLLALNAAIEAARAGDFGRGFAVVADEVRQLAARTSQSTTEIEQVVKHNQELTQAITGQIESVSHSVQKSSELNQQVASVIEKINQGAEKVSQTVASLALEKQPSGA